MALRRFELLRSPDALLAIAGEWDNLFARSRGAYFLSFQSCWQSWVHVHQPKGRGIACALLRDDDGIVAILPMVTFARRLWRVAQTMGPEAAESCDILLAPAAPAAVASEILDGFMAAAGVDILDLPFTVTSGPLAQAIQRSGRYTVVSQVEPMPYAVLRHEGDWAPFEKSLSRSYQQQTGRKGRRLQEKGTVTLEVIEGAADAPIDWLLDQKAVWGRKVGKLGPWLFAAEYRAYLKALAGSGDRILTFVLSLDGAPCAVKVIAVGPALCMLIIGAYDEAHSALSPGSILDAYWIKHIFDNFRDPEGRPLDIDFGVGLERYKTHWARGHALETKSFKLAVSRWGEVPYRLKTAVRGLGARAPKLRPAVSRG